MAASYFAAAATLLWAACHCAAATQHAAGTRVAGSAVQKVIELLSTMSQKAEQEKADEATAFAKFAKWCSVEDARLQKEVAKTSEAQQEHTARAGKLESDASVLGREVQRLNDKMSTAQKDKKSAADQREKDHAAFLETSTDFAQSVDALDSAIEVLQEQNVDRPASKGALLQLLRHRSLDPSARFVLAQFAEMLDDGSTGPAFEVPEANAYEFQSGGVLEMLSRLREQFQAKLEAAQKEEASSAQAYNMIAADLADTLENAEREVREKDVERSRKLKKAALEKRQSASLADVKSQTENTLATTTSECVTKKASFEEKQALRAEELEAMAKALDILKSAAVQDATQKHLAILQSSRRSAALVQLERHRAHSARQRIRDFLAAEGRRLRSQHLVLLAEKLAVDPFAKVQKLLSEMLNRLQSEAHADATHEGFCDKELGKSQLARSRLSEEVDGLTAAVEEGRAGIIALAESSAQLMAEVDELRQAMGEAADMRAEEKAKNKQTVKEAQEAQTALAQAKKVLTEFYDKAASSSAFLQAPASRGIRTSVKMGSDEWKALANPSGTTSEGAQTSQRPYQGQQDKAEYGVLTLLEVVLSDFEGLEADTKSAEAVSQKSFEVFTSESRKSIKVKEQKVDLNNADRAAAEEKFTRDKLELKALKQQLTAAERYHKNLVPQCVDQGTTFKERSSAREAELDSLRQALDILSSS